MDEEDWRGLIVRTRDGKALGVVAGGFAAGPLAGRLRVEGGYVPLKRDYAPLKRDYAPLSGREGPPDGTAVFAIPRRAVGRRQWDSLVLDATLSEARGRCLMHVLPRKEA